MAFLTAANTTVELLLNNAWVDITGKVRLSEGITITRGRADEASGIDPSSCSLVLDNRDGRFSPRNPTGPYYGIIGRNTQLRVSVKAGTRRLANGAGLSANCPDTAALSITGDVDIRADLYMPSWSTSAMIYGKSQPGARSYRMVTTSDGYLQFNWSADGSTELTATSTVPLPRQTGRQAVRATIDVDNGASGRTITFYTATTLSGTWVQLGSPVVQAGVTSIHDNASSTFAPIFTGWQFYGAETRQGIGGTVRANPDFTAPPEGATSFVDGAGNTWSVLANITNRRYRFIGEVASWPNQWGTDQRDIRCSITAAGITRRLGQGATPLQSAMRRGIATTPNLVAYWPMEDAEGSTSFASAVPGAPAMAIGAGGINLAASTLFAGSAPLPTLDTAVLNGPVPAAADGTIVVRGVVAFPSSPGINGTPLLQITTSGTGVFWWLSYLTASGGQMSLVPLDSLGNLLALPVITHSNMNGATFEFEVQITTSGANVLGKITTVNIATDSGLLNTTTPFAGSVGHVVSLQANLYGAGVSLTTIGHLHVLSALSSSYALEDYVRGQVPETPGLRVQRLCGEKGVTFVPYGYLGPSNIASTNSIGAFQGMGPQPTDTLLEALDECVAVDLGMLLEPRDTLGLGYRPREALYGGQNVLPSALTIPYSALQDFKPVEDDQEVRNDITVARRDGSSARAQLTTGALSVQAPPNGVGVYDEQIELNIQTDAALPDQANFRLRLGTLDEARFPTILLKLAGTAFQSNLALTTAALDLEQGDLITVTGMPSWMPPDPVRQLVEGFTETITDTSLDIELNCTPGTPWQTIGFYDEGGTVNTTARYGPTGSTLAAGVTAGATSWQVTTATPPLWTTDPAEFPIDLMVAGEQVTVTAISGTSNPQTFTVTRAVNGVSKAQSAGAAVTLYEPAYYAL